MLTKEQKERIRQKALAHKKALNESVEDVKNVDNIEEVEEVREQKPDLREDIEKESDLLMKLAPIPENEIYDFMDNLKGGTYFNMGMYSSLPIAKLHKSNVRIYKVIEMSAIVSGVDYENIGTTKDFRDQTGKEAGKAWYDHEPGREHKVGLKRSNPEDKYVLWQIRSNSGTNVRYFLVDFVADTVEKIEKADILASTWLTESEKDKLKPKAVTGYNLETGELVSNETVWKTAAFNHIFWLKQGGSASREYGKYFEESFGLQEDAGADIFFDAHAGQGKDLDALLSSYAEEEHELALNF